MGVPNSVRYIFMIFIIGVRNIDDNLEEGAVQVSYEGDCFEEARTDDGKSIKPGKEMFRYKNEPDADNNFNNLDEIIKEEDNEFFRYDVAEHPLFVKPLYFEVLDKDGKLTYDATVDLEEFL